MEFRELAGLKNAYDQIVSITEGGMAEIYRGRQIALNRPVAIKRIRPDLKNNSEIQKRFRREAQASANLLHQNLAHVYDYIEEENEFYIIMEFIDGIDLSEIITRSAPMPEDVSVCIALKILQALSYVHSHGMVHRDIKPENIRINTRGEVKIMDFGIALDPGESSLTMPGVLIGSPHYLSPEQISGKKINEKVDLFSFGISFYEMLTGNRPFVATDHETVFSKIQKGDFPPLEDIRSDINPFVIKILERCLSVDPQKRASSAQWAEALQSYISENLSFHSESRVRQYLMKEEFFSGDPKSIEVPEKTQFTQFTRRPQFRKLLLILLASGILLGTAFVCYQKFFKGAQETKKPLKKKKK